LKFESKTHEAQLEDQKSQGKAQESHLEEGKTARPIKGTKSGKSRKRVRKAQNQIERVRKAQNQKNSP
jgi:hypothetical protein